MKAALPNIVNLLISKFKIRENGVINKIKSTKMLKFATSEKAFQSKLDNPCLLKVIHTTPHPNIERNYQTIKKHKAYKMKESELFNFMELNNPGRNSHWLMKYHVNKK